MSTSSQSPFVSSVKVLFDILDVNQSGYIFLSDIEQYWDDDHSATLPNGIVDSLRTVATSQGLLNFVDFVHGLRLAMQNDDKETLLSPTRHQLTATVHPTSMSPESGHRSGTLPSSGPDGESTHDNRCDHSAKQRRWTETEASKVSSEQTDSRRRIMSDTAPNDRFSTGIQYRSQRHPAPDFGSSYVQHATALSQNPAVTSQYATMTSHGQRNPVPRTFNNRNQPGSPQESYPQPSTGELVQDSGGATWRSLLGADLPGTHAPAPIVQYRPPHKHYCQEVVKPPSGDTSRETDKAHKRTTSEELLPPGRQSTTPPQRAANMAYQRVRETRRHTLQTGVDFQMVKSMKLLEQERDVMSHALLLLDQSRSYLQPRLQLVYDKQKQLQTTGRLATPGDADESFITRVTMVSSMLQGLVEGSDRGFPPSTTTSAATGDSGNVTGANARLKQALQEAEERIKKLEDEKVLLIREIFEERCKRSPYNEDSLM